MYVVGRWRLALAVLGQHRARCEDSLQVLHEAWLHPALRDRDVIRDRAKRTTTAPRAFTGHRVEREGLVAGQPRLLGVLHDLPALCKGARG